jgi:transcriptional regulator with XRE-family HTH domain
MPRPLQPPPAPSQELRHSTNRERRGLTQEQLARQANISTLTVSRLERGAQEPFWPIALAIADALGVSVAEFAPEPKREGGA